MLNVVFLTLITSFAAMILLNAAPRIRNSQSSLRLTALYLANEQFAQLESLASEGKSLPTNFLGKTSDLTTKNFGRENSPITFEVTTQINGANPYAVTVKVSWTDDGKSFEVKSERRILVVENS